MLEHTRTHPINHSKVVEILFSNNQRYTVPIEHADELSHLLENLKYVKKLEAYMNEWVSLETLLAENVSRYTQPGLALKGARLKEGLTQTQLAKQLHIRQENLSKMEHGKRPISPTMAKRLAKILKIDYRIFL